MRSFWFSGAGTLVSQVSEVPCSHTTLETARLHGFISLINDATDIAGTCTFPACINDSASVHTNRERDIHTHAHTLFFRFHLSPLGCAVQHNLRDVSDSHTWVWQHPIWEGGDAAKRARPHLVRLDSRTERHVQSFARQRDVTDATSVQLWKVGSQRERV